MDHSKWLAETVGGDKDRTIGERSGVPWRTIGDQRDRDRISAENVIAIAIGYGRHPVTALIDCGYLPARYATAPDPLIALRNLVSEDELAEEVLRRMKLAGDHVTLATPIDELANRRTTRRSDESPPAEVTPAGRAVDNEPAAARSGNSAGRRLRDAQDEVAEAGDRLPDED